MVGDHHGAGEKRAQPTVLGRVGGTVGRQKGAQARQGGVEGVGGLLAAAFGLVDKGLDLVGREVSIGDDRYGLGIENFTAAIDKRSDGLPVLTGRFGHRQDLERPTLHPDRGRGHRAPENSQNILGFVAVVEVEKVLQDLDRSHRIRVVLRREQEGGPVEIDHFDLQTSQ